MPPPKGSREKLERVRRQSGFNVLCNFFSIADVIAGGSEEVMLDLAVRQATRGVQSKL